ncbi:hypothetical protein EVAR_56008_1 [Eumeta japonica]|uniref:Uncharacterized protein n=1 Tax=Eumeta variegata TaxID=151549 RepID=A0A4C1YZU7_EUMVA|nr:hypothetical protein EVAR_56008_1 [Eumeta japonica]
MDLRLRRVAAAVAEAAINIVMIRLRLHVSILGNYEPERKELAKESSWAAARRSATARARATVVTSILRSLGIAGAAHSATERGGARAQLPRFLPTLHIRWVKVTLRCPPLPFPAARYQRSFLSIAEGNGSNNIQLATHRDVRELRATKLFEKRTPPATGLRGRTGAERSLLRRMTSTGNLEASQNTLKNVITYSITEVAAAARPRAARRPRRGRLNCPYLTGRNHTIIFINTGVSRRRRAQLAMTARRFPPKSKKSISITPYFKTDPRQAIHLERRVRRKAPRARPVKPLTFTVNNANLHVREMAGRQVERRCRLLGCATEHISLVAK